MKLTRETATGVGVIVASFTPATATPSTMRI